MARPCCVRSCVCDSSLFQSVHLSCSLGQDPGGGGVAPLQQGPLHQAVRPREARDHQRARPRRHLHRRGGLRPVRLRAGRPAGLQLPHRRGHAPLQRPQQDRGLPEDLLRLVQPVREIQTCNTDLGEKEGEVFEGRPFDCFIVIKKKF